MYVQDFSDDPRYKGIISRIYRKNGGGGGGGGGNFIFASGKKAVCPGMFFTKQSIYGDTNFE